MARVSPGKNNFNGGEFSPLVDLRIDIDRHPSGMRTLRNYVGAPQGPAIRRSGTEYEHDCFDHAKNSALIPFVFSDEQANVLEFGDLVMRILSEDGVLVYSNSAITSIVTASPFKFTSAALATAGAAVGDQVALAGFPAARNLEGVITAITAKSGNDYTVAAAYNGATGAISGPTAGRVFKLVTPYVAADVRKIVPVQDLDLLYLFCSGYQPQKLTRTAATTWTIAPVQYIDGPFLDEPALPPLWTPGGTGQATDIHTTFISGANTVSSSGDGGTNAAWKAFDNDATSFWQSSTDQEGWLQYQFGVAKIIEGYTVYSSKKNTGGGDSANNLVPVTFTFAGSNDGTNFTTLDEKFDYALWQNYRTQYIKINNSIAYAYYRLTISALKSNGSYKPSIARLVLRETGSRTFSLTAASVNEINKGSGFLTTDIGRLVRLYQEDGYWRSLKITGRTSTTVVTVELQEEPLLNVSVIRRWRLGLFSDTTGWPATGCFFEDRLVVGGAAQFPTTVALSATGQYDTFSPTDKNGAVVDDNGMRVSPKVRNAAPLRWLAPAKQGLIAGFGSATWILKSSIETQAFTARTAKASISTSRGNAAVQPSLIDDQVILVSRSKRELREHAYTLASDGFKTPSMSLFATHLGLKKYEQLVYQAEPYSIVWVRRADGSVVGLTYNRDENVVGWHQHDFASGVIESVCVTPGPDGMQDVLWMVVNRTINSTTKRYIEKLMPFWDFTDTLATAHYVDCGLRATFGVATVDVYNLSHLEGKSVYGLADNIKFGPLTVTNGHITLPNAALNVVVGLNFESYGETLNFEAGAADGVAQGKVAHIHNVSVGVWASVGGEIGVNNEDTLSDTFAALMTNDQYRYDELGVPTLYTGIIGPLIPEGGYGKRKSLIFRQRDPYPYNVVGLYPQFDTQDRG